MSWFYGSHNLPVDAASCLISSEPKVHKWCLFICCGLEPSLKESIVHFNLTTFGFIVIICLLQTEATLMRFKLYIFL